MITLRIAVPDDLERLIELNQRIMVNNQRYDDDLIVDWALTADGRVYFEEVITRGDGVCFILLERGVFIGYANGGKKDVSYRKSRYFELENIGVIPEKKGQGFGKMLLEEITKWAKGHKFEKIYLNYYQRNEEALRFYKENGFSEIDICLEKEI